MVRPLHRGTAQVLSEGIYGSRIFELILLFGHGLNDFRTKIVQYLSFVGDSWFTIVILGFPV